MHNPLIRSRILRHAILAASVTLALTLLPENLAQAQGMPGATVGLPMGSPDPFGLSTVNRPSGYSPEPYAEPGMDPAERRIRPRPQRRLKSHRNPAPKRRAPMAGR